MRRHLIAASTLLTVGLLASACGPSGGADASDPAVASAAETAATNQSSLRGSSDVTMIEVLDVADGSITTLADAVDGDRPVLVWFWAPH